MSACLPAYGPSAAREFGAKIWSALKLEARSAQFRFLKSIDLCIFLDLPAGGPADRTDCVGYPSSLRARVTI